LKVCNGLWFLHEDPASWGAVELARLHRIAGSVGWLLREVAELIPGSHGTERVDGLQEKLSVHCAGGGFELVSPPGSPLAEVREALRRDTACYLDLERAQREATALLLGLPPGRLRSDITIPTDDPSLLQSYRSQAGLTEVATHAHQALFRFTPSGEAREALDRMNRTRQRCHALEATGIAGLCGELAPLLPGLWADLEAVGELDVLLGRARWASQLNASRPGFSSDGGLLAGDAVHPEIRRQVEGLGRQYQSLSFELHPPVVSLTGANMGGKTAFLRTVALLQSLFQRGYFVPARTFRSSLFNSMAWMGAVPDSPTLGLSSFGRECRDLIDALELPEPQLLLVDEFARSTDAEEGLALTGALLDHLQQNRRGLFLFAGHQKNLGCEAADEIQYLHTGGLDFDAYTAHLATMEPTDALAASMNYQVFAGKARTSDALQIARALGVPKPLVRSAQEIWEKAHGKNL
jgi:DNA mismatch repair ATPase MutS